VSENYINKIHASVVGGCRRICLRRRHAVKELSGLLFFRFRDLVIWFFSFKISTVKLRISKGFFNKILNENDK
jgi:hypothetical protein